MKFSFIPSQQLYGLYSSKLDSSFSKQNNEIARNVNARWTLMSLTQFMRCQRRMACHCYQTRGSPIGTPSRRLGGAAQARLASRKAENTSDSCSGRTPDVGRKCKAVLAAPSMAHCHLSIDATVGNQLLGLSAGSTSCYARWNQLILSNSFHVASLPPIPAF